VAGLNAPAAGAAVAGGLTAEKSGAKDELTAADHLGKHFYCKFCRSLRQTFLL
jgi:hypothetical protein